jgi:hypothetical protein
MWENVNSQRRAQRYAAMSAAMILVALLVMWPVGGAAADWLNSTWAPTDEADRYQTVDTQDDVDFVMETGALKASGDEMSYYIWENSSGDVHYNNISNSAGSISVDSDTATSGVDITGNRSWNVLPYFRIYFDYTALEAYEDNVVQIRLHIQQLDPSQDKSRSITLSAGGVTFYSKSISASDTTDEIDKNITIDANQLREAIINAGEKSYFKLIVKGVDDTIDISGSTMYTFASSNLVERDDPLMLFGALTIAATYLGIIAVQPHNSLPFSKKGTKKGGF